MSTDVRDVLVVGGGPAGSAVARLLALRGWSVALFDRADFPRAKPCGECLNPGAVAMLDRLGLLRAVLALEPARLRGWRVEAGARVAVGSFPSGRVGLSLSRARLDGALLAAARDAGVDVRTRAKVVQLAPPDAEGRRAVTARTHDGALHEWRARVVIGADGLRSFVARSLGAHRRAPRLRKVSVTLHVTRVDADPTRGRLLFDPRGTVGLAPLDDGGATWNLTVVVDVRRDGRALAGDPAGFALARLSALSPGDAAAQVVGGPWTSGPFDWPTRTAVGDGVALVGDAAGYYDPLTGQGIYRALRSAELAAPVIDRALAVGRASRADLAPYESALRRELRVPVGVQHGVEAIVASDVLRPAALALLGRTPFAMDALVALTGDVLAARRASA